VSGGTDHITCTDNERLRRASLASRETAKSGRLRELPRSFKRFSTKVSTASSFTGTQKNSVQGIDAARTGMSGADREGRRGEQQKMMKFWRREKRADGPQGQLPPG